MSAESFGEALRRRRGHRTLQAVATSAGVSCSYVHKLENGRGTPSIRVVEALDAATNANGELIAAFERDVAEFRAMESRAVPAIAPFAHIMDGSGICNDAGEDATERRRLLQLAASAGMGALGSTEQVRQLLEWTLDAKRSAEDWNIACADHLHALRTRPAAQVVTDLVIDFYALRQQMETSAATDLQELHRTAAMLSSIQANALTRLGDHGAALRWWHTARHAADASRDNTLNVLIRAEEASCGLYGQRSPATVLRLVEHAHRIAIPNPCLKLVSAKAKALAMLGRPDEASETMHVLLRHADQGAGGDAQGVWTSADTHFTRSWVHSAAGEETLAEGARQELLRLTADWAARENSPYRTNTDLHAALGMVVRGAVDSGMRHAAEAIDTLPSDLRHVFVMETGRMVLRAVPFDQRSRPAVNDLRAMLTPDHDNVSV